MARRPAMQALNLFARQEARPPPTGATQQGVTGYLGDLPHKRSQNSISGYRSRHRG